MTTTSCSKMSKLDEIRSGGNTSDVSVMSGRAHNLLNAAH